MRILHISSAAAIGGGEVHLAALANALAQRGHEVHIATRSASPLRNLLDQIPAAQIHVLPLRNALDLPSAFRLSGLVRDKEIEIVHAHLARDYPLAAYACARNSNSRLVLTRHVLFPLGRLHRYTLPRAARVIAVSHAVKQQLLARFDLNAGAVAVIHNGIDCERFAHVSRHEARARLLQAHALPQDALVLGSVGELSELKGQIALAHALARILQRHRRLHLLIAGTDTSRGGVYRKQLEAATNELGLHDNLHVLGWVSDTAELLAGLDLFVSASSSEAFGIALLEAMAAGCAILTTRTQGALELMQHGETGWFVESRAPQTIADAACLLMDQPELRSSLALHAQARARDAFSIESMVDKTEKLYRDI